MLEIKSITKVYETEGFKQKALDNISVNFRKCEFTSILGPSGSGKTTFLNIIGGLDHYTSGDLIINGISTKKFKDSDWDSYRNHRIGFVFQNYNLINHQSVLSNVKLALTLSGINKKDAINRAKKALKDVGLEKHMYKKPNQLSGGQMQRVAIARALVNDPDILLADEPTGALDSETSIQIMGLLKNIAKEKLVIMVTHNPDLAKEYSSRIITLKDGFITSDSNPYDGKDDNKKEKIIKNNKSKKTSMSFFTALTLSFNNLMTKKGRTILVSFAGSIGIIGIALILALSTGFQNYIDQIQEDTLTTYPLNIMQESTDITGALLSMTSGNGENDNTNVVKEEQYITKMLSNISTNDLKSFKKYVENNYNEIDKDISTIKYTYSIDPLIYTIDATNKYAKLNPSNLFSSIYGSSMLSSYSSMASIFTQMIDKEDLLNEQYDILIGSWPSKFNEMVLVLSEPNSISDLLVYSLGLRDTDELTEMVSKIMSGESVKINNEPLTLTYEDLLNIKLKLIKPTDLYRYNNKYDVYEDMSNDLDYLKRLYDNSLDLKIVGIVTAKEGITSRALSPGVAYRKELIDYIINEAYNTDIVKKQLAKEEVDVFSGQKFNSSQSKFNFDLKDLIAIDNDKLQSAFNINISEKDLKSSTSNSMNDIANMITTDISPAKDLFNSNLHSLIDGLFNTIDIFSMNDIDEVVDSYLDDSSIFSEMQDKYIIPKETFKSSYSALLKSLLKFYITEYNKSDSSLTTDLNNPTAKVEQSIKENVVSIYYNNPIVMATSETMAKIMTETLIKKNVLAKVGELINNITKNIASSFKVDEASLADSFKLKLTEDELARIISAMMMDKETNAKTNLISLGYQDKEEPTYISFYFNSFDGKEHFMNFIETYNDDVISKGYEDKVINYTDTTGILMNSVKTIVNAVSYVLIAFVSISLVVSSIMIGIITYISVYERTKEIGVLRAIGASKRNISSIFNAETFIIGLLSGLFGIGITYSLIPIINLVIHHFTGRIPLNAMLDIKASLVLVLLSIILTLIGGLIPAKAASKKDPVEALRSE